MTMKTELLEALIRQCVREVLDQVDEEKEATDPKLTSSGIGKGGEPKKVPVKWGKRTKFTVKPKKGKLNEEEEDPNKNPEPVGNEPAEPTPPTSQPEEPQAAETPSTEPSGKPENPSASNRRRTLPREARRANSYRPAHCQGCIARQPKRQVKTRPETIYKS